MPNTLEDLREHLFETLKALRDKEQPMSIDRAKAIADVAQTVINSAKAEVDYIKATDQNDATLPVFGSRDGAELPAGVTRLPGVTTHKLR